MIHSVEWAALEHVPEEAIPLLLSDAVGDTRDTSGFPSHPLRILEDWTKRGEPRTDEAFIRRATLQRVTLMWARTGDAHTAIRIIPTILSPRYEDTHADPGAGRQITLTFGYVSLECMRQIQALWPEIKQWLCSVVVPNWQPLFEVVHHWTYKRPKVSLPDETWVEMKRFVHIFLNNLTEVSHGHPGVNRKIMEFASRFDLHVPLEVDPEFFALFPLEDFTDERGDRRQTQQADAARVASAWSVRAPGNIIPKIVQCEVWTKEVGLSYPRLTPFVCWRLAETTSESKAWAEGLISYEAAPGLIEPFLKKLVTDQPENWEPFVGMCLESPLYRAITASVLLPIDPLPDTLLNTLMAPLSGLGRIVESTAAQDQLSRARASQLLIHDDLHISCSTAVGLWLRRPKGVIPEKLRDAWQQAILRSSPELDNHFDHWIKDILKCNTELAFRWIQRHLNSLSWHDEELATEVVPLLNEDQRSQLIDLLSDEGSCGDVLINALIGKDPDLYSQLLRSSTRSGFHLAPLKRSMNEDWISLALLARQHGYLAEGIVLGAFGSYWGWDGNASDMWTQWLPQFERLCRHENPLVRDIGMAGYRMTQANIDSAKARER